MAGLLELEAVKSSFLAWRSEGNSRRHMSIELKEQALSLLSRYSEDEICKHLELSKATLKNWLKPKLSISRCNESPTFVSISAIESAPPSINQGTKRRLHLTLRNDVQFELFEPSIDDISALAQVLLNGV